MRRENQNRGLLMRMCAKLRSLGLLQAVVSDQKFLGRTVHGQIYVFEECHITL